MKRTIPFVLLIIGLLLANLGWVGAQDSDPVFAMVSFAGADNPFFAVAISGMEDACAMLDAQCHWLFPTSQVGDWPHLQGTWQDVLALEPDGIGTLFWGDEPTREGIMTAAEGGIPVMLFNTNNPFGAIAEALPTLAFVGDNDFAGGVSNARRVFAEAVADGVVIARGVCTNQLPGHRALEARCDGVESVFDDEGVPLDRLDIAFDPGETSGILAGYFAAHPDANAIFMLGPVPVAGLNRYIQEAGLEPRQLYATGYDVGPEIFQLIEDGYLLQTIDQQPYVQGFLTIIWLYLNSQFALVPGGDVYTGPSVIDQSNLEQIIELTALGYR